ncbi:glycerol uptake facilitator protein GlpF [Bacillus albus]|uniref:Glycerol uptake facilitator protein GlpF n=1 Tax=Bacillus albus TaxID=2026189 RepID=A0ABM7E6X8_9BACI|nr:MULTISPECIES: glycerol uptake facilitator protein GlpF [Bacillus]AZQ48776.1 glycerol uptake facilitator protein GlpF [Bacillus albus]MBU5217987.1 glycerol uptake facilitator protein GlpF [Bacillus albus]MDA2029975.1 glycerol uptake facilitator protein GlpF [Bacillus cereus group sp. Bcc03]MDA2216218.1 glycerol uptake facilitator protein GlpF [Bacillus cereus group sp. Bc228]MDA2227517.1 glycerol uptake facilitator protein GlpF [Bacillus cereus group sp. Bc227]
MSAFLGELVGTALLILLGGGVCAGVSLKKSFAKDSGWIVITMGWGLAVAVAAYAVGSISGAHLNPALTIGLAFKGAFPWSDVPGYIAAQMIGAIIGAVLVYLHYLPHWKETEDPGTKLGVFATGPAIPNTFANLLSEMIGTFVLVFGILAIGANKFADGLNPFIVGFLIVSIGLSLGGTTGYAINPARDLGPRIAHFFLPIAGKGGSNWKYAWIPVVGPILGGSLAGLFHQVVFEGKQNAALIYVIIATVIVLAISYMTSKKSGSNTNSRKVA